MRQVALEALRRTPRASGGPGRDAPPLDPAGGPVVADVSVHGTVAFVLLVHRRHDGSLAEELYRSACDADGAWEEPDHLGGGLVGVDLTEPSAVREVLRGHATAVVSESGSLIHTGRTTHDDGYEFIRFFELLVADSVSLVEVENMSAAPGSEDRWSRREVSSPLMLFALWPDEHVRVRPLREHGSSCTEADGAVDLCHPGSTPPR